MQIMHPHIFKSAGFASLRVISFCSNDTTVFKIVYAKLREVCITCYQKVTQNNKITTQKHILYGWLSV